MNSTQLPRREAPPANSCFVVGESRTNLDNSITRIFGSFYMGFEVERETEAVIAFNCTHTMAVTEDFLRGLFLGAHFPSIDEWLEKALDTRYGGSSKRAVLASYRDALKRYRLMTRD
jgi:beta-lactamase class A